ncbi:MAG: Rieske 2Fe-2S domain-containing protein [Candidatus Magnetomorum sp.]|nr:Rieske 2Fe-2S domain-containing protein [Candidatus Magnetomorum sp.]
MAETLQRNIFQRLLGLSATSKPLDDQCWTFSDGKIEINLNLAKELTAIGGAVRLEKKQLPENILVIHGTDDKYYAFNNKCKHMGRRMDPVPGTQTIQCCSIGKTTYDYDGKAISGSGKGKLCKYPVEKSLDRLVIRLKS